MIPGTTRLRLDVLEASHARLLFTGLRDQRLYEYCDDEPPESAESLAAHYAQLAGRRSPDGLQLWLNWAIWAREEARYVGFVQATILPDRSSQIAYRLFHEAWGKGYAQEAASAMLAHLRESWHVTQVEATVDPRNQRSIRTLLALGFSRVQADVQTGQDNHQVGDELVYRLDWASR